LTGLEDLASNRIPLGSFNRNTLPCPILTEFTRNSRGLACFFSFFLLDVVLFLLYQVFVYLMSYVASTSVEIHNMGTIIHPIL
jgi:hypothetical protein